jgi:Protein of unknown function (DUF3443)
VRQIIALVLTCLLLAACGGGSGDDLSGGGSSGSGGGSSSGTTSGSIATAGSPNVEPIVVDAGPAGLPEPTVNTPFVTIKVCAHGSTTNCQLIDHVEVDTGSFGLRLLASVLTITLPAEPDSSGNPMAECLQFADNTVVWGTVGVADILMPTSGETASSVNVQLIGSTAAGTIPSTCLGSNTAEDTLAAFGANGIIGVGEFPTDCNEGPCSPGTESATYYSCPSASTCAEYTATYTQQLQNPVTLFAQDNNGTILELPAITSAGSVDPGGGVLVFGIGTRSNNSLTGVSVLQSDPDSGVISATLNGTTYDSSYFDSGSNAIFIENSGAATCTGGQFLCPTSTVTEDATLTGTNNGTLAASFSIANADTLFTNNPNATAYNNLGAAGFSSSSLDLGMPFFFGQNIYTAIENPTTGTAPYYGVISN